MDGDVVSSPAQGAFFKKQKENKGFSPCRMLGGEKVIAANAQLKACFDCFSAVFLGFFFFPKMMLGAGIKTAVQRGKSFWDLWDAADAFNIRRIFRAALFMLLSSGGIAGSCCSVCV